MLVILPPVGRYLMVAPHFFMLSYFTMSSGADTHHHRCQKLRRGFAVDINIFLRHPVPVPLNLYLQVKLRLLPVSLVVTLLQVRRPERETQTVSFL